MPIEPKQEMREDVNPVPMRSIEKKTETVFSGVANISGTVRFADTNKPVVGGSVIVTDKETGTITDVDGSFELETSFPVTVEISYIGFEKVVLELLSPDQEIDVRLVKKR